MTFIGSFLEQEGKAANERVEGGNGGVYCILFSVIRFGFLKSMSIRNQFKHEDILNHAFKVKLVQISKNKILMFPLT